MSSLKTHHLSPFIFKLPSELFSAVVLHVADSERPYPPASVNEETQLGPESSHYPWTLVSRGGSLGWIKLTHVCRIWRAIICEEMPVLWGQDIGRLPAACGEMLRRAGETTALDVQLGYNHLKHELGTYSKTALDLISQQYLDRIRTIRVIDVRPRELRPPILSDLCRSPKLEHVEVHYLDIPDSDDEDASSPWSHAYVLQTPLLRSARFTNYFIPWTSRSLTRLSLAFEARGLPYDILYGTLKQISDTIEELELDMCIPAAFPDSIPEDQPVNGHFFPKLRSLRVREVSEYIDAFLWEISIPPTAALSIEVVPYEFEFDWLDGIKQLVEDVFGRLKSNSNFGAMYLTRILQSDGTFVGGIQLRFAELGPHGESETALSATSLVLSVELNGHTEPTGVDDALIVIFNQIAKHRTPLKNVAYLDFHLPLWRFQQEASVALSFLPGLRRLRIVDPLNRDTPLRGHIPTLPVRRSTSQSSGQLESLCIVQTNDSQTTDLMHLCGILDVRLDLAVGLSAYSFGPQNPRPLARLRLEIEDSGSIPDLNKIVLPHLLSKFADEVEMHFSPMSTWGNQ